MPLTDARTQAKFKKMTTEPVEGLICKLAVPTIISMLITTLYNLVNTYFVGKINTSAVGAVGIVFSLMAVIQAIGFFFGQGSGIFISHALGQQDDESASRMAVVGVVSSFVCGIAIMVIGLVFLEPLSRLLGSTETILPYTKDYMLYILLGTPFITTAFTLNNQLRFQGSALYGMIGIASGAILNIGLSPLFILKLQLGVGGAAMATSISEFVSFVILLIGCNHRGNISIRLSKFSFRSYYYREIFKGGFPSLLRQGMASVATLCLNLAATPYGDAAIAAMSIVSRIVMFLAAALIGFGQGFQPVCGFNYGAKLYERVRHSFRFCVKTSFVVLCLLSALCIYFAPQLIMLFRKGDPDVVRYGAFALQMQCITLPLSSWIVMSNMMQQNVGETFKASFIAFARQGMFFIPAVLLLPHIDNLGFTGVQIAQSVADVITLVISIFMQLAVLRKLR
jgi:putative MATE family efflux protein